MSERPIYNSAPCGFCQGDGMELRRAHTDAAQWITCTHCGGSGYGLTREEAEARAARTQRVRKFLALGTFSDPGDIAHWLDLSLGEVDEALAWMRHEDSRAQSKSPAGNAE